MRQSSIPQEAPKEQPSVTPFSEERPAIPPLSEELPPASPLPEVPPSVELPVEEVLPIDLELSKAPEVSLETPEPSEPLREAPEVPAAEELPIAAAAALYSNGPNDANGVHDVASSSRQPGSVAVAWSRLLTWLIAVRRG